MKFIKKNKFLCLCATMFILVMVFAFIGIINILMPNKGKNLYGNRLDGINDVPIAETTIDLIKNDLIDGKKITNVTYDLKGKIANFIITVGKDTDELTAKSSTSKILGNFSNEQKNFYDIQVFVTSTDESEIYPIIGYKHITALDFTWTNN